MDTRYGVGRLAGATGVVLLAAVVGGLFFANLPPRAQASDAAPASLPSVAPATSIDRPSVGVLSAIVEDVPAPSVRATAVPRQAVTVQPAVHHVWLIMMENKEYSTVIGSPEAPYLNGLAAQYGLATQFYATGHPSLTNYVALVAGSTLGVRTDVQYHLRAPSLFSQLAKAGRPWRVYAQDDRNGCYTGVSLSPGPDGPGLASEYVRKHNPAINFASIVNNPAQCRNIQPLAAFDPTAGAFEMIVPNLLNDMHNGTIAQGDAFLKAFVPSIIDSPAFVPGSVLFITFDEGKTNAGLHGDKGGQIPTLVIAPGMTAGERITTYEDHYSILRATEDVLGLPCLASACHHAPISW